MTALAKEPTDVPSTSRRRPRLSLHKTDRHEKRASTVSSGWCSEFLGQDPLSGHLFLFLNRRRDRVKILFWERDGLVIWYKRLEAGTFQKLDPAAGADHASGQAGLELTATDLALLLTGIDRDHGAATQTLRPRELSLAQKIFWEISNTCSVVVVYMIMTEYIDLDPIPDDLPACQELLRAAPGATPSTSSGSSTSSSRRPRKCSAPTRASRKKYLVLKRMLFGPRRERLPEAPRAATPLR